ncbi:MAG: hypothetical protein WC763_06170 [Candidatus Paceibacterota bacterium]|jgi:hypothetical protein
MELLTTLAVTVIGVLMAVVLCLTKPSVADFTTSNSPTASWSGGGGDGDGGGNNVDIIEYNMGLVRVVSVKRRGAIRGVYVGIARTWLTLYIVK